MKTVRLVRQTPFQRFVERAQILFIQLLFAAFLIGCFLHDVDMDRKEDALKARVQKELIGF